MARWLRFLFYGAVVAAVLAASSGGVRHSLWLLSSRDLFAPDAGCVACAVGLLLVLTAYSVWLAGATVAGSKMPLPVHLVPLCLLGVTLARGPLIERPPAGGPNPPERAVAAMRALAGELRHESAPCRLEPQRYALALGGRTRGFRSFARARPYQVAVRADLSGPAVSLDERARPGVIYLACAESERRFFLSAVVTDALPTGRPVLARDGVGRPVVITEEYAR